VQDRSDRTVDSTIASTVRSVRGVVRVRTLPKIRRGIFSHWQNTSQNRCMVRSDEAIGGRVSSAAMLLVVAKSWSRGEG
jgi:hypothetical protein